MMVFILIPLGVLALGARRSRPALIAFVAMGILAWLPGQLQRLPEVQILQLAVWPIALALLVGLSRRRDLAVTSSSTASLEYQHA
jgi:hypothetical protein